MEDLLTLEILRLGVPLNSGNHLVFRNNHIASDDGIGTA